MKTTILTIALALTTLVGISKTASAATGSATEVSTVLTDVSQINRIEVRGNVQLYLSDGSADQVKVYNSYYAESALVQDEKGVLRITSYSAQTLKVWVTANDLRKLEVYDNASVVSFGKLSVIDLDVKLFNNASAKLDVDAYAATITLSDHTTADLSGSAERADLVYEQPASINTTSFAASHLVKTAKTNRICSHDAPEFASL